MDHNPVRGEAEANVGDVELVLVAEMQGLAQLSAAIGCQSLPDLYGRLAGTELATTIAAIRAFTLRGRRGTTTLGRKQAIDAAIAQFSLSDTAALQAAFIKILAGLTRDEPPRGDDEKNGEAPGDR